MLFVGQLLHTCIYVICNTHHYYINNANCDIAVDYYIYLCAL